MTKRIAAALVEAEGMEAALPGTPSFDVSEKAAEDLSARMTASLRERAGFLEGLDHLYPNTCDLSLAGGLAGRLLGCRLIQQYTGDDSLDELCGRIVKLIGRAEPDYTKTDVYSGIAGIIRVLTRSDDIFAMPGAAEAAAEAPEQIEKFCIRRGADPKTAEKYALFVEEIACNTVEHGFKNAKHGTLDIRVIYSDELEIIRFRDDGRPFDPVKWLELNHPDDPLKGAGIRIVVGMAKEVRYMPAMGLNNLLIIL